MISVTCAIIENQGKVLVTQRSAKMALPLKWEFPGGKLENGESEIECIQREIREELSLTISIKDRLPVSQHDYPNKSIKLIPFICGLVSGDIKLTEHQSYAWLTQDELQKIDWAEADVPVLINYLQRIKPI